VIQRLHLVDGTWELFRAHFSKRPEHHTPGGKVFKATAGLVASLLGLLADEAEVVTHVAVAFDNPIRSFRNDLYAGYKTEAGVDPDLLAQFDDAEAAVRALGVTVWSMDRWECDDALATGAARFRDQVQQVRICSPDKDLGACVRGERVVVVDRQRKTVLDEARLRATKGIGPESVPDYLALVGDTADGIPGVPGFGEKTTSALLGRFVHLEAIPALAADWGVPVRNAPGLAATLAEHHEAALLWKKLATLIEDVPLRESMDDLEFRGVPRAAFSAWCSEKGLASLAERPLRWA
jgi:5'-3' exonuclease